MIALFGDELKKERNVVYLWVYEDHGNHVFMKPIYFEFIVKK